MNSPYEDSLSRSLAAVISRRVCVRWVISVVAMDAPKPTNEPSAAANAVSNVESMVSCRPKSCQCYWSHSTVLSPLLARGFLCGIFILSLNGVQVDGGLRELDLESFQ